MAKKAVRYRDQHVETATWTLSGKRTVTLIGMMHIGDDTYYEDITKALQELETSSAIQYELIRPVSREVVDALGTVEKARLLTVREKVKEASATILADALGLQLQKAQLQYPDSAKNVDYTDLELFRRLGYDEAEKLFNTEGLKDVKADTIKKLLRFVITHHGTLTGLSRLFPRFRKHRQVILEERNLLALEEARRALRTKDVTLVWGAAHLPGMLKELEKDGYRLTGETWRQVCKL